MSTPLERLEQAWASLQTIFRTTLGPRATAVVRRTEAGATLDEVQGEIDAVRAEFDSVYAQVQSLRDQASVLDPRPDAFLAQLDQSLNVNRNNNYQTLERAVVRARENTSKRNQDTAAKAEADQGSGAQSAGAETAEEQRANAEGSSTQNPGTASEQQSADGTISATPATVVPTNAESSQPAAVPTVPGGAPVAVAATPTDQNQLPGTPSQGQDSLQPPSPSGAQQFNIYKAIMVTSNFSGGRFTQDLEGLLLQIPVASAQRQDDVLVPEVPEPSDVSDTTPVEAQTNGTAVPSVIPGDQIQAQAPAGDATVYGTAETAPPDSDGQSVAVAQPSGATGEGSATTTVGGFTIKAVVGPDTGGAAFTVSRGGSTEFAFGAADIYNAAVKLVLAGLGGDDQAVIAWVNARGPQELESQALAQARSAGAAPNSSINLARET